MYGRRRRRWDRWMWLKDVWTRFSLFRLPDEVILLLLLFVLGRERIPEFEIYCHTLDRISGSHPPM